MTANNSGRAPDGAGLSQAEPVARLGPSGFDPSRIIAEAHHRRRLTMASNECNADDVRFWDAVIRFLGEFK